MLAIVEVKTEVPSKDYTSHRIIELSNKNKIHVVCKDPFGFWSVHYDTGGVLPKSLQSDFTTFDEAYKRVEQHVAAKNIEVIEIKNKA